MEPVWRGSGGPIWKDRFFGFGSFQRNPTVTPVAPQFFSVPTLNERQGIITAAKGAKIYDPATGNVNRTPFPQDASGNFVIPQNRLDPVSLKILNFFPLPNVASATNGINNYVYIDQTPVYTGIYDARFDLNLSPKHRIYTSGLTTPNTYINPYPAANAANLTMSCKPIARSVN